MSKELMIYPRIAHLICCGCKSDPAPFGELANEDESYDPRIIRPHLKILSRLGIGQIQAGYFLFRRECSKGWEFSEELDASWHGRGGHPSASPIRTQQPHRDPESRNQENG